MLTININRRSTAIESYSNEAINARLNLDCENQCVALIDIKGVISLEANEKKLYINRAHQRN